ncbi:MAG: SEC-C domain-containing protein [Desulfovibrio sp.]|nr:SEC-C domain-containing protein [Desulfovibrio sp.]
MSMFDPDVSCHCGSGKKYKDCCMDREQAKFKEMLEEAGLDGMDPEAFMEELQKFMANPKAMEAMEERLLPLKTAGDILARRWGEQELSAVFFGGEGWDGQRFRHVGMECRSQMDMAFCEWVLSQANPGEPSQALASAPRDIMPPLSRSAYDFVEELPGSALSLYEVQDRRKGEVLLLDLLAPKAKPVWAVMQDGDIGFFKWDIAGLRLLGEPGSLHLSPAVCTMPRSLGLEIAKAVKSRLRGNARRKRPEDPVRVQTLAIVHGWLGYVDGGEYEYFPLPEIPPKPKETALEVTGVQGVVDWGRVEAALDRSSAFVREGGGWVWTVEAAPGRSVVAGRLENWKGALAAAAPNEYLLQALRTRLEALGIRPAPLSLDRNWETGGMEWRPAPLPLPAGSKEWGYAWLVRDYLGLLYMRVDYLDGMSAKEMLARRGGRARAAEFLKVMENAEDQRWDDPVVPAPLDLGFLWRELGLEDMLPKADQADRDAGAAEATRESTPKRARIIPFEAAKRR